MTDQDGNHAVSNRRLTCLASLLYDDDAVMLKFMMFNKVCKVGETFNVAGSKVANVSNGTHDTGAVNLR